MDKLKYIKLENEDGSYSSSIPLAVDSDHVDVNGNPLTDELNNKANNSSIVNLQNQINSLASGSPLVASSVSEMTDTSRIYVNSTDGKWYYYNGANWVPGGVYQATQIAENSVGVIELSTDFKSQTNNLLDVTKAISNKKYTTYPTPSTINDLSTYDEIDWTAFPIINVVPGGQYRPFNGNGVPQSANDVLYFDQNGNFVSKTSIASTADFTIPENIYYLCFNAKTSYNIVQFKRTDIPEFSSEYEPYKYKSNIVLKNEIENIEDFFKLDFLWKDNSYVSKNDGLEHTDEYSTNYSSSDFVPVISNHNIIIKNIEISGNTAIIGYDKNKNMIDYMDTGNSDQIYEYDIKQDVQYIKVSAFTNNKNSVEGYYTDAKFSDEDNRINNIENRLNIFLDNLLLKINNNAILTWIDDDTNIDSIPIVKSLCDELNIKCTFGCVTSKLNEISGLLELLKSYQLDGFHITSHTHTHDR